MKNLHSVKHLTRENLELALAIAEEGTVTHAALRLHLSQSALSHHLRALEDRIGAPLFERGSRRMTPTSLGEELVDRARRICSDFRASEEALDRMIHNRKRIFRLGTECYTSFHWLPALVREMARKMKDIDLHLVVEATHRSRAALASGETDAVILLSSGEDPRLRYWQLFRDELVLLVSAQHALAQRQSVQPKDLASETLILHDVGGRRQPVVDEFFVPAKIQPKGLREVPLTEAIIEMVRAQMGVSVLAHWIIKPYIRDGELRTIRLGKRGLSRTWRLAAARDHPLSPEIEQLAKVFSSLLQSRMTKEQPKKVQQD
jgi:LysR family transcriptional regulator for metE and metH